MHSPYFWIIPVAIQGAIMGSFLNVVVFRLPLGLSVWNPRWSFCPNCRRRIAPICNIPIVSWLWLHGRCRECHAPISSTYPLVEAVNMLLFVMVWDALFIAQRVPDVNSFAVYWPLGIAYLGLFACLLASSAMDIESYTVHIELSIGAMLLGILAYGFVGLPAEAFDRGVRGAWAQLPASLSIAGVVAGITWAVTAMAVHLLRRRRDERPMEPRRDASAAPPADLFEGVEKLHLSEPGRAQFRPAGVLLLVAFSAVMIVWQLAAPDLSGWRGLSPAAQRGFVASLVCMLILVLASMVPRTADQQVMEEIEREMPQARGMILRELAGLLPAIGAGLATFWLLSRAGLADASWQRLVETLVSGGMPGGRHLAGALGALGAGVLAAGLGWAVRILGTIAFGKEAFGTGDIYLMAAIGAVGGFWLVGVGFFLSAILALIGVAATLVRKSSRAVPFGPWLALGAFAGLWVEGFVLDFFRPAGRMLWSMMSGAPL